jgi:hypothetical protein
VKINISVQYIINCACHAPNKESPQQKSQQQVKEIKRFGFGRISCKSESVRWIQMGSCYSHSLDMIHWIRKDSPKGQKIKIVPLGCRYLSAAVNIQMNCFTDLVEPNELCIGPENIYNRVLRKWLHDEELGMMKYQIFGI